MAKYTVENYRLDPATGTFTRVASYITMKSLEFYKRRNGYGQMFMTFDVNDPSLNRDDLKLYRNNFLIKREGGAAWLGPLTGYDADMEDNYGTASVESIEYFYHLNARQTEQNYQQVGVTASQVAWNLIDAVQSRENGNLGIVQGSLGDTAVINETLEYANVDEAIINQSDNIGGYDFYLQPTLDANGLLSEVRFNVVPSLSRIITDKKITPDQILSISTASDREMYNTTTALGGGTGDEVLTVTATDTPAQLGFTRRERVLKLGDYRIPENLQSAANTINDQTKAQRNLLNITLSPAGKFGYSDIQLGDIVEVDFKTGVSSDPDDENYFPPLLQLQGTVQVYEINVRVDENGVEYITPKVKFN